MSDYAAIYDVATGAIWNIYKGPDDTSEQQLIPTGYAMVVVTDGDIDISNAPYVDMSGAAPVVMDRPVMPATLDGMTISNIPGGAVLSIEGTSYTVTDGVVELSFGLPGVYTIKLACWPYLDQIIEVTAP